MGEKQTKEYRTKLWTDLFSGIIPDRVPVRDGYNIEFLIQYAGYDLLEFQYDTTYEKLMDVYEKAMTIQRGDIMSAAFARNPVQMMFQQSIGNMMSDTGMIQHPEHSYMSADEYDEFTKNPHEYILENVVPNTNLAYKKSPAFRARAYAKALLASRDQGAIYAKAGADIAQKYNLCATPAGANSMGQPPFDYIADFCRGFSHIPADMRRCPEKLIAAMDAMMPYFIWLSKPANPHILGAMQIMTHMAAFLSVKQYEKFYFPYFNELIHINAQRGTATYTFLEGDWERFLDSLTELPMGTRMFMEYGSPKAFKDTLGKKLVMGGFYPLTILKTGTKEQCIDKAKELIDIMAPGGNYFFNFDKSALHPNDVNIDNYIAVLEYVKNNTYYDNSGAKACEEDKCSTIKDFSGKYPEFKSKYILSYDEFKKEYPPVNERADALMRIKYDKYCAMVDPITNM